MIICLYIGTNRISLIYMWWALLLLCLSLYLSLSLSWNFARSLPDFSRHAITAAETRRLTHVMWLSAVMACQSIQSGTLHHNVFSIDIHPGLHTSTERPLQEVQYKTSRNLRMSPMFPRMQANKAVYGQIMGYERPLWFEPQEMFDFGKGPGKMLVNSSSVVDTFCEMQHSWTQFEKVKNLELILWKLRFMNCQWIVCEHEMTQFIINIELSCCILIIFNSQSKTLVTYILVLFYFIMEIIKS